MVRRGLVLCLLAGCGRIAFDARTDAADDDASITRMFEVTLRGAGADWIRGVSLRPDGGFAAVGQVASAHTIETLPVPLAGAEDVVLVYLDAAHALERVQSFGGNSFDTGTGVVVDSAGNSYVVGTTADATNFGAGVVAAQMDDAYVVSFSPTGAYRWHHIIGGAITGGGADAGFGVTLNGSDVIVVGAVSGSVDFGAGATPRVSPTGRDAFVAAYTQADGSYRWAHRIGGDGGNTFYGLSSDNGTIYVSGSFEGTPDFLGVPLASVGNEDAVLASLTADGGLNWVRAFGSPNEDTVNDVAIASNGDVFAAGFHRTATTGDVVLAAPAGYRDGFVLRYTSDGALQWATPLGATACGRLGAIAGLANGNAIAVGGFRDNVVTPAGTLTAVDGSDAIVVEISASGALVEAERFGGPTDDYAQAVAGIAQGSMLVGASLASATDPNCAGLSSGEEQDLFLGSF